MKKIFNLALALGLILSMPMFLTADEEEVEIQLVEVMGTLPGDDPFDGNSGIGIFGAEADLDYGNVLLQ